MKRLIIPLLLITAPILFTAVAFLMSQDSRNLSEPSVLISRVSKHYVLPENEEPTIATVTDKSKLTTEFFKSSENGDKILIYESNRLAIVYRPSIDRLVAVGPVDISQAEEGSESSE